MASRPSRSSLPGSTSPSSAKPGRRLDRPNGSGRTTSTPDVRPTLIALRSAGLRIGIAGNQTVCARNILQSMDLPSDMIATSDDWGASKPDPAFFDHVAASTPYGPKEILYVGDRLDNDIRPAVSRGLQTALIRRGPWEVIQQADPDAGRIPTMRIDTLTELPSRIAAINSGSR